MIAALAGIGFIVAFIALPWKWHLPGTPQNFRFYTPALGGLMAALLLFMGIGLVLWAKWLMPEEEAIQDRHDEESSAEEKLMTEATLVSGLADTGLPRRGMILKSLGLAGGALATVPLVALVGGMLKKPGDQLLHTMFRPNKKMFPETGGRVPLVLQDWRQVGPNDLEPGGIATVFPGVREEIDGYTGLTSASSPTLLIRLKPGQTRQVPQGTVRRTAGRRNRPSTSRTPRSAPTPAARRRCTSSRPRACSARATSRSSRCSRTRSRCSARRRAACRNCRSTW